MFETVVPETAAPKSRRLFYETLPLSVALHAIAAGALVAANLWDVMLPLHPPKLYAAYQLIATPPPPPPPPPPAVKARVIPQTRAVPVKMPLVAPTVIPDEIPVVVTDEPITEIPVIPVADEAGQEEGLEGGVAGGEAGGQIGGVIGGVAPPQPVNPNQIEIKRDDPLPMGAISQEFPQYPEFAQRRMWEDTLVVRYIIDKNGRVKEVIVLTPPEREEFTRATVSKIRQWRFHPYRDADGNPKEVAHELTVNYRIVRKTPGAK
jgi:protein TonB